jgi:hypothetical protein
MKSIQIADDRFTSGNRGSNSFNDDGFAHRFILGYQFNSIKISEHKDTGELDKLNADGYTVR